MASSVNTVEIDNNLVISKDPAYSTMDYKIITGTRENSHLLWVPIEKQLYVKNSKTAKSGIHYLCNIDSCKIRVYIKDNVCYKINDAEHNHETCESKYEKLLALNEIKAKVMSDKYTQIKDIFNQVMTRHKTVSLKFKDHVRTFQKLRNKSMATLSPINIDSRSKSSADSDCFIENSDEEEKIFCEPGVSSTATMSTNKKPTISTHILDTSLGQAAANIPVTLYAALNGSNSNNWIEISSSSTNNDGRCADLSVDENYQSGFYKLRFDTAEYFQKTTTKYLYPFVEIAFYCEDGQHYHIPLLLQPFGYTTYRGT